MIAQAISVSSRAALPYLMCRLHGSICPTMPPRCEASKSDAAFEKNVSELRRSFTTQSEPVSRIRSHTGPNVLHRTVTKTHLATDDATIRKTLRQDIARPIARPVDLTVGGAAGSIELMTVVVPISVIRSTTVESVSFRAAALVPYKAHMMIESRASGTIGETIRYWVLGRVFGTAMKALSLQGVNCAHSQILPPRCALVTKGGECTGVPSTVVTTILLAMTWTWSGRGSDAVSMTSELSTVSTYVKAVDSTRYCTGDRASGRSACKILVRNRLSTGRATCFELLLWTKSTRPLHTMTFAHEMGNRDAIASTRHKPITELFARAMFTSRPTMSSSANPQASTSTHVPLVEPVIPRVKHRDAGSVKRSAHIRTVDEGRYQACSPTVVDIHARLSVPTMSLAIHRPSKTSANNTFHSR